MPKNAGRLRRGKSLAGWALKDDAPCRAKLTSLRNPRRVRRASRGAAGDRLKIPVARNDGIADGDCTRQVELTG
jgi:hypothetical protein